MKNIQALAVPFALSLAALAAAGTSCSSMPRAESSQDISVLGPTVLDAHAVPGTIELNRDLQPMQPAQVVAQVKDFKSEISSVQLRFQHVPLEIPMHLVGGSTYSAELTPNQVQMLAVSGRTVQYSAMVIAHDSAGKVGTSSQPVTVSIKSPQLVQPG
jgi:hypothetical protein